MNILNTHDLHVRWELDNGDFETPVPGETLAGTYNFTLHAPIEYIIDCALIVYLLTFTSQCFVHKNSIRGLLQRLRFQNHK
jgi:hypothetical protein